MLLETNFNHNLTKGRLIGKILHSNDLGYLAMRSDLSYLMRQVKPLKVSLTLIVDGYNSTWSLSLGLEINIYISLMCTHQLQVSLKAK